jgi:hypothetical protein
VSQTIEKTIDGVLDDKINKADTTIFSSKKTHSTAKVKVVYFDKEKQTEMIFYFNVDAFEKKMPRQDLFKMGIDPNKN